MPSGAVGATFGFGVKVLESQSGDSGVSNLRSLAEKLRTRPSTPDASEATNCSLALLVLRETRMQSRPCCSVGWADSVWYSVICFAYFLTYLYCLDRFFC